MVIAVFFRCLQQATLRALKTSYPLYSLCTSNPEQQGFVWIKFRVSYDQSFRRTFIKFTKQTFQHTLLSLRSGVARSLAVNGKPSYICHTEGMAVMILAIRSNQYLWSPTLNGTVCGNHIVILTATPTERTVVTVNVRYSQCAARTACGAMYDNHSYCSHRK